MRLYNAASASAENVTLEIVIFMNEKFFQPEYRDLEKGYRYLRSSLRKAIRESKRNCYKKFYLDTHTIPLGAAYNVVIKTRPRLLFKIVEVLSAPYEESEQGTRRTSSRFCIKREETKKDLYRN